VLSSTTAVARDSGVDSVLSLPHQGYALEDADTSVPGLEHLGLAEIHIPAAGDDDDVVDNDNNDDDERLSLGYSHYEDIESLDPQATAARRSTLPPPDDLYLDPRRPDPSGRTSASLGRQPTNRSDRCGSVSLHCY